VDERNYKNVDCFTSWSNNSKTLFIQNQDRVVIPFISKRGMESGPLPEIKAIPTIHSKEVKWSSKMTVSLVKFHRSHHDLLPEAASVSRQFMRSVREDKC
jgi:hypothetical protein